MRYQTSEKIVEKELSYKLGGIFFKIQKRLGRFCRERQYADALEQELITAGINYKREYPIKVANKKSNFVDFIINDKILVDLKIKPFIEKEDYFQIKRYLKAANKELGLIVNFRDKYLKPKRVLNSEYSDKFVVSNRSKGFTLFELIIVTTIIGILAAVTVAIVPTIGRGRELETERDKIVAYLRYARQKSVSQEEGKQWGVRFDNTNSTSPNYKLFHTPPYNSANVKETIYLSSKVQFNRPTAGNTIDIVFAKITGTTTAEYITIALRGQTTQTKTASTSAQGVITSD